MHPRVSASPRNRACSASGPHRRTTNEELERQLGLGAVALKVRPVHDGAAVSDRALYPAYRICQASGIPVMVHCGTSSFPGSSNALADPVLRTGRSSGHTSSPSTVSSLNRALPIST